MSAERSEDPKPASAQKQDHIQVGIRFRPFSATEIANEEKKAWLCEQHPQLINVVKQLYNDPKVPKKTLSEFSKFNHVFTENATNLDIYQTLVTPLIQSALDGINGTIFCYGQTASGKTHTMKGGESEVGLLPLSLSDIFESIAANRGGREYLVRISYLEIYNEGVRDLLAPAVEADLTPEYNATSTKTTVREKGLMVREDEQKGFFVQGLTESLVYSVDDCFDLLFKGEEQRHYGETLMNDRSSRSHTIFRVIIESIPEESADAPVAVGNNGTLKKKKVRVSVLNFVDLAGSERRSQTQATGDRAAEGTCINHSLHFLGIVIQKLAEGKNPAHVPFRNSPLTKILQNSLGGNARTVIICNAAGGITNVEHTVSTLRFASNAVKVTNDFRVNEMAADKALISQQEQRAHIREMRSRASILPDVSELKESFGAMRDQNFGMLREMFGRMLTSGRGTANKTSSQSDSKQSGQQGRSSPSLSSSQLQRRRGSFEMCQRDQIKLIEKMKLRLQKQFGGHPISSSQSSLELSADSLGITKLRASSISFKEFEFPKALTPDQRVFFDYHRALNRVAALEQQTKDLLAENGELLDQIDKHLVEEEDMAAKLCDMEAALNSANEQNKEMANVVLMLTEGRNLEGFDDATLRQLEQDLANSARRVTMVRMVKLVQSSPSISADSLNLDAIRLCHSEEIPSAPPAESMFAGAATLAQVTLLRQDNDIMINALAASEEKQASMVAILAEEKAKSEKLQQSVQQAEQEITSLKDSLSSTVHSCAQMAAELEQLKRDLADRDRTIKVLNSENFEKDRQMKMHSQLNPVTVAAVVPESQRHSDTGRGSFSNPVVESRSIVSGDASSDSSTASCSPRSVAPSRVGSGGYFNLAQASSLPLTAQPAPQPAPAQPTAAAPVAAPSLAPTTPAAPRKRAGTTAVQPPNSAAPASRIPATSKVAPTAAKKLQPVKYGTLRKEKENSDAPQNVVQQAFANASHRS